jgi:hypothetical protein
VREAPSSMARGLFGYCLFFLMYSLVAGNFRLFPGALLFWIAVGLALSLLDHGAETAGDGAERPSRAGRREYAR